MTQYHSGVKEYDEKEKFVAVLGYITIIGWLVALFLYGEHKTPLVRFHLRQSLGLIITAAILSFVPLIGWILNAVVFIVWLVCIYHAFMGHIFRVPVMGDLYQEYLDFVI